MKTKNKYFLLRHGQTIFQKEKIERIYSDDEYVSLEITQEGREKIAKQAEILKEKNIDLIFSSPLLRARQSAQIVSEILGSPIIFDDRLVDMKMGEFSGQATSVYDDFFLIKKLGLENRPNGGENWVDILARMKSLIGDIEAKYENKNILIVSHGEPLWLWAAHSSGAKTADELLATRKAKENNLYPETGDLIEL
ncbi:MAG TPA: histidine phosphatase family protein [Candidatus Staskawiczbacteria bacterium]|nr:histidine phosphatase family protein [Candidatus Staskawiczbacteria bacterium]